MVFSQVSAQDINNGINAYKSGDYITAFKEFKPLAEQGDAYAQNNLGLMYKYGNGVPMDTEKATKWIRLSANQGLDIAQNYIGNIYEIGLGVTQDYSEALKWYTLSAEQGYDFAQNRLGNLYSMGLGVLQDNVTAHMWYNIASANGHEGAGERRDEISHKMTNEDISIAARMARECVKSDYKNCGYSINSNN